MKVPDWVVLKIKLVTPHKMLIIVHAFNIISMNFY